MIDSVDGMMNAAADAHDRPARDELPHRGRHATRARAPTRNSSEAELQRALAAEAVAERAGREQQAGEHERVDGDDPLELRLGGVQLARQRRDRDVEARVADEDDQQAQAEHGEGPPAAVVERLVGRVGRARCTVRLLRAPSSVGIGRLAWYKWKRDSASDRTNLSSRARQTGTPIAPILPMSGVGTAAVGDRPLRADARRNRERVLAAAEELFAEQGCKVQMDEVARRAGVGVGTVCRNFPTKEALVEAVLDDMLEPLVVASELALADPDPADGLRSYVEAMADLQARSRGLAEQMSAHIETRRAVREARRCGATSPPCCGGPRTPARCAPTSARPTSRCSSAASPSRPCWPATWVRRSAGAT